MNVAISFALIAGTVWVALHRQDVVDWWRLRSYQPSAAVLRLANDDGLVGKGRQLFYASDPAIDDKATFNTSCPNSDEQSLVLGCYKAQRIYIYDVQDARLHGVREVTAAHEMLHAVYDRLGADDKKHVNDLVAAQLKTVTDDRILKLIDLYNQQEPGELYNEMHSILGTEYANLSPELETYYKQYFSDRKKVVNYAQEYEAIFAASKVHIAQYDQKLGQLKAGVEANNTALEQKQRDLQTALAQLNQLRAANNIETYNQAVPAYNDSVHEFNDLVATNKSLINQYNDLVAQRNQEVTAQNGLYQSLDSRYQTMSQH